MVEHDLDEWYRTYHRDVFAYIGYQVRSRQDAEDIAQEVFVRVLLGVERFQGLSSPKTWILTIARRTVVDWYRKKRLMNLFSLSNVLDVASEEQTPYESVERQAKEAALRESLRGLKQDMRDVVILRMMQEFSTEETAAILGWSSAKTRTTLHRAMKKLHQQLGADSLFEELAQAAEEGVRS
ncbi:RNA polymerase sigma factor [Tumebacillus permanentifrigoris]|uniref:RNA polymerase sigma factor n=1 Tax=Tumebacillus permanentifrigoris TaxID=378543 RepID=A0A316DA95_9BACL|nr:RNA polymerase sigma factor [Tumebacillus permanentifrigoris]PWK13164.1 RNA polymerase sigma (SigX) subunit [Tumebacillus permanentifrigoris]